MKQPLSNNMTSIKRYHEEKKIQLTNSDLDINLIDPFRDNIITTTFRSESRVSIAMSNDSIEVQSIDRYRNGVYVNLKRVNDNIFSGVVSYGSRRDEDEYHSFFVNGHVINIVQYSYETFCVTDVDRDPSKNEYIFINFNPEEDEIDYMTPEMVTAVTRFRLISPHESNEDSSMSD